LRRTKEVNRNDGEILQKDYKSKETTQKLDEDSEQIAKLTEKLDIVESHDCFVFDIISIHFSSFHHCYQLK